MKNSLYWFILDRRKKIASGQIYLVLIISPSLLPGLKGISFHLLLWPWLLITTSALTMASFWLTLTNLSLGFFPLWAFVLCSLRAGPCPDLATSYRIYSSLLGRILIVFGCWQLACAVLACDPGDVPLGIFFPSIDLPPTKTRVNSLCIGVWLDGGAMGRGGRER